MEVSNEGALASNSTGVEAIVQVFNGGNDAPKQRRSLRSPLSELDRTEQATLAEVGRAIADLDRNVTDQAFEIGALFSRAKSIVPERAFGRWLRTVTSYTVRSAYNFEAVHKRLAPFRLALVAAGISPTILFVLVRAEDKVIENVITSFEAGERLKVSQVKAMVCPARVPDVETLGPLDVGGEKGLLHNARVMVTADAAEFLDHVRSISNSVDAHIQRHFAGERPTQADLLAAVVYESRHAHDIFRVLLAPLVRNSFDWRKNLEMRAVDAEAGWGQVQQVLFTLGSRDTFPKAASLIDYLIDCAAPALRFALGSQTLGSSDASGIKMTKGSTSVTAIDKKATPRTSPRAIGKERVATGAGASRPHPKSGELKLFETRDEAFTEVFATLEAPYGEMALALPEETREKLIDLVFRAQEATIRQAAETDARAIESSNMRK